MNRRISVSVAGLVLAFVGVAFVASAQQQMTATIDFPFVAGGKAMEAGKYTIEVTTGVSVLLRGSTGSSGVMTIITTLGRHDLDKDAELVFDKADGKLLLSEIWLPGRDGLLVLATKRPHEHAVVGGSNPRK